MAKKDEITATINGSRVTAKAGMTILVGRDTENDELTFEGISSSKTPPVELAGQE